MQQEPFSRAYAQLQMQGWSEGQANEMREMAKEEIVGSDPEALIFSHDKKFGPTGHVKLHTPPQLEKPLVQALRATAARVFQVRMFVSEQLQLL